MPELFVLEFEGFESSDYEKVNSILGIDPTTGEGDWPDGLITHSAGKTPDGWIVVEVWDSREAQERFMSSRLGAALHQAGLNKPPKRADWTTLRSHHHPKHQASSAAS